MLGLLAAASSARRATWAGFASAHQPPPHEFRNRPCEPKTGLPVDFFRHPARTHAAALKKILRLSASIEGKLRRAKPSDPSSPKKIRVGLLGLRVMEEAPCIAISLGAGRPL